ncbi:hypothetical protein BST81_12690 [Leptolyngbya sp. 'hensonii']|uniref:AAA family ATPase n=1 Tax=Leptolyngbya sp. 'hensonii' TaxID=1922337 RepID=UPI00094F749C|nr:AAA family ATPase [Leptolyngbya sp. 'hensonii']OLP17910.1 hypothetical protein BST81_12690 [Leptolyngbya sp. 'hensonii']
MPSDRVEYFADNWNYLKAELNWLDRVLMMAVARQRKESKEVERVTQSRADRVTSHWWKGLILVDGEASYDDGTPPKVASDAVGKLSYQQQIQARIQASCQKGIHLGLPIFCDRLQLTGFEKNVVLMSLAPEINRRYARIYSYLQGNESLPEGCLPGDALRNRRDGRAGSDLPTVDLVLRLLCRNDLEWRMARARLSSDSPLLHPHLLRSLAWQEDTFLAQRLQLAAPLVNYLLADQPTPEALEALLQSVPQTGSSIKLLSQPSLLLNDRPARVTWSDLLLPPALLAELQSLSQRVASADSLSQSVRPSGAVVLLIGPTGTGKTTAATAIAQALKTDLTWIDLMLVGETEYAQLLQEIAARSPKVLLIKSARYWLGRFSPLPEVEINRFLQQRRATDSITLLSLDFPQGMRWPWRQQLDQILEFPLPDEQARLQLWQQAFPAQVSLDPRLNWKTLAHRWAISGGEIQTIAREAALEVMASPRTKLKLQHITQAVKRRRSLGSEIGIR